MPAQTVSASVTEALTTPASVLAPMLKKIVPDPRSSSGNALSMMKQTVPEQLVSAQTMPASVSEELTMPMHGKQHIETGYRNESFLEQCVSKLSIELLSQMEPMGVLDH